MSNADFSEEYRRGYAEAVSDALKIVSCDCACDEEHPCAFCSTHYERIKSLEPMKDCPECAGNGTVWRSDDISGHWEENCEYCGGKGKAKE